MALYQELRGLDGTISGIRGPNGASIPIDPGNSDYQAYLSWVAAGNTADPAPPAGLTYRTDLMINARIRTTDATPTEVYRTPLASLTGYTGRLTLIGVDAGNGAVRIIYASVMVKRLSGGAIMNTAPVVIASHAETGTTTWALAASVSGNDFVVTVTGAAGRNIDWSLSGNVMSFTPSGA